MKNYAYSHVTYLHLMLYLAFSQVQYLLALAFYFHHSALVWEDLDLPLLEGAKRTKKNLEIATENELITYIRHKVRDHLLNDKMNKTSSLSVYTCVNMLSSGLITDSKVLIHDYVSSTIKSMYTQQFTRPWYLTHLRIYVTFRG